MKLSTFIALLIVTFCNLNLYASSFCNNPYKTICDDTAGIRQLFSKSIQQIKNDFSKKVEIRVKNRNEQLKLEYETNKDKAKTNQQKSMLDMAYMAKLLTTHPVELVKLAEEELSELEKFVLNPEIIENVKFYFAFAIEQMNLDVAKKQELKNIISAIYIGNFKDFNGRMSNSFGDMFNLFLSACGQDGLNDNAFATKQFGIDYVLVCPGWLINFTSDLSTRTNFNKLHSAINNSSYDFNNLIFVLAHEFGHHIDSEVRPELYQNFLRCTKNHYVENLLPTNEDKDLCKSDLGQCNKNKINSHARELTADFWASKVIAIYLRENNFSIYESEIILKESFQKMCGSRDEGIHPSDRYRLDVSFVRNTNIMDHLYCLPPSDSKPICDLDGQKLQFPSTERIFANKE